MVIYMARYHRYELILERGTWTVFDAETDERALPSHVTMRTESVVVAIRFADAFDRSDIEPPANQS